MCVAADFLLLPVVSQVLNPPVLELSAGRGYSKAFIRERYWILYKAFEAVQEFWQKCISAFYNEQLC